MCRHVDRQTRPWAGSVLKVLVVLVDQGKPQNGSQGGDMSDPDLVALWEAHCRYEFESRDVDATMATMIDTPYVNHVPTMTGGVGHDQLKRFYKYHFIGGNPDDTKLVPVSRTV